MGLPVYARWAAVVLASLAPLAAASQPPAARLASVTIENDFFAGYDRHYTNGIQAAFLVDKAELPAALRALPPLSRSAERDVVLAIGQRIYTPTDTSAETPDPADRPFAGWLYVMADVKATSGSTVDHFTASLGVVGPASLGRYTHKAAHELFDAKPPNGWSHQLRNELTVLLGYERAWRDVAGGELAGRRFDLSVRAGGALGNAYTYASAGAVLRYGEGLPSDLPATHISLGPPRDGYRGASQRGWYVWAGVDGRAVAHNIFLDGNTFEDSAGVERKPFGYDWQVGAALVWPAARIGFTLVQRSREFEGQHGPDRFGQLALSFAY